MADEKELEEIRKLPPKERLMRLKELETRRKKQEDEARRIVEESLKEIKLDEMLQEIEVPKQEEIDINRLFGKSKGIEEEVAADKALAGSGGGADYARRIQELLPQNTLQEIQQWYSQDNVPPTRDEFLQVYEHAREAYDVLRQSMQKPPDRELYSTPSEELVEDVVQSMRLLRSMGYKMNWFGPGGG
ncbi:hypothetical protein JW898_02640 [Candidatus Woesearchaeota archaeon]|nr:hypothetical protein [Candidatus Woesearchaeota archaeon]